MKVTERTIRWTVNESLRRMKVEQSTKFYQWIKIGEQMKSWTVIESLKGNENWTVHESWTVNESSKVN